MTQRQKYAVVPKSLLDKLIYAVEQESMAYADPIAHVDEAAAALEAWQAAPPPPDQVLSGDQVMAVYHEWLNVPGHATEPDLIRLAERAVLKQQGAKNGE